MDLGKGFRDRNGKPSKAVVRIGDVFYDPTRRWDRTMGHRLATDQEVQEQDCVCGKTGTMSEPAPQSREAVDELEHKLDEASKYTRALERELADKDLLIDRRNLAVDTLQEEVNRLQAQNEKLEKALDDALSVELLEWPEIREKSFDDAQAYCEEFGVKATSWLKLEEAWAAYTATLEE